MWAIGVDSDQYEEGLYTDTDSAVLTSMLKRVDTTLVYALNAVKSGSFKGEVMTFDLAAEGVGYATTNTKALSQDLIKQIDAEKAKILSGAIKVAPTLEEAKATPNFPADIKAQ